MLQLIIDALNSITGWTESNPTKLKIHRINDIDKYIANEQSASLIIKSFEGDSTGEYVQKTFTAIDVSNYDELVMWVYSTRLKNNGIYMNNLSEFKYQIDFNNTMQDFCIPLFDTFTPIVFDIRDITSIDRIKITALHDELDYLLISSLVAYKDQIPLDIYKACKTKIETNILNIIGTNGILIGTTTGIIGNKRIKISGNKDYLAKYSIIKIISGGNTETHQIEDWDESRIILNDSFDGESLLYNHTTASVYLQLPVNYGLQRDLLIPGILIKGWTNTPILRGNKTGRKLNSYRADRTVKEQRVPQILNWYIEFHIESRSEQILQYMSDAVRNFIESQLVWINGKNYEIDFNNDPTYIEPILPEDLIHKIVYTMKIEIQENWDIAVTLPNTTTITDNFYINANV